MRKYILPISLVFICILIVLALLLPLNKSTSSSVVNRDECTMHAYVFDIGSGASKSYKYHIDSCGGAVEKRIIDSKVVHLQYQQCIDEGAANILDAECIEKGRNSIREFEEYYGIDCASASCFGVATAWARNALNSDAILDLYQDAGIELEIIDQSTEGQLAYDAIIASLKHIPYNIEREGLLVLDLGGGSHQVSYEKDGKLHVFSGKYGNANFYDAIVKRFGPDVFTAYGVDGYFKAEMLDEIMQFGAETVGKELREGVEIDAKALIGLGRTLYIYLNNNLKLEYIVTKDKLKEKIVELSGLSQEEAYERYNLGAVRSFVPFMQSSLLLIYSILEGLDMNVLYTVDVKITDSVLENQLENAKVER